MHYLTAFAKARAESHQHGTVVYVCSDADNPASCSWYRPDEAAPFIDAGVLQCDAILLGGWQVWAREGVSAA